jgi:hypothetical protein
MWRNGKPVVALGCCISIFIAVVIGSDYTAVSGPKSYLLLSSATYIDGPQKLLGCCFVHTGCPNFPSFSNLCKYARSWVSGVAEVPGRVRQSGVIFKNVISSRHHHLWFLSCPAGKPFTNSGRGIRRQYTCLMDQELNFRSTRFSIQKPCILAT